MKLKIKVLLKDGQELPKIIDRGDWIDLSAYTQYDFIAPQAMTLNRKKENSYRNVVFNTDLIPLGVAMKLPKGFEAIVLPRSSTFNKYGVIVPNSMGVIDNSYNGNDDEWKFPVVAFKEATIHKGDRIGQFRIQLSQKATFLQKLRWLFTSGIELVQVDSLSDTNRGGFGSTGVK